MTLLVVKLLHWGLLEMDGSSFTGAFLSGGGFLGLDARNQEPQQHARLSHQGSHSLNPDPSSQIMQSSMDMITGLENDNRIVPAQKSFCMSFGKGKGIASVNVGNHNNNVSEDDEPSYGEDGSAENTGVGKGKKGSPWQRMKWTDNVVRLLIAVVACVGDDGSFNVPEGLKRKSVASQKKGKWKTVSKVMISKGCHVSPQQCEDKFNDLNKRYKKLNDILGRGKSCVVVEDPSILDSMRNIPAKMKEDVKKILSSKHLFYQEMCAYHNGQPIPNCGDLDLPVNPLPLGKYSKENNISEEEEEQVEEIFVSEDDKSDYEDYHITGGDLEWVTKYNERWKQSVDAGGLWPQPGDDSGRMQNYTEREKQNEENGSFWPQPGVLVGFEAQIGEFSENHMNLKCDQRQSIKKQLLRLQEQGVHIKARAFEIEQRSFKWLRFCRKKETELERLRLNNQRMRLVNERMVLQLKRKELDIDSKGTGH